jgi:acyl-CoA oxidase
METTAHFDPEENQFILNSPTDTSMKFWIGNLAKTATMAVVFAQLITERVKQGVHGFLIPIRDKNTHIALPGIEIGDCGDKIGLQHVDNGWIKFHNHRVSKNTLLNKFCDVTSDGVYFSVISDKKKRFAFQIGSLSGGRIAIGLVSSIIPLTALTTALRYQAIRKQFKNPNTKKEQYLLDYHINQYRLLTHFSRHMLFYVASNKIVEYWDQNLPNNLDPKNKNSNFIHLMSSLIKAYNSWESNKCVNECRQAMGGIGYSYYSGMADMMTISDLNRTWEGDNNVLFQQAGRLILKNLVNLLTGKPLMPTCEFLKPEAPEPESFKGSINNLKDLVNLITYKVETLIHKNGARLQMAQDKTTEWDKMLAHHIYPMAFSFYDRFVLVTFIEFLKKFKDDEATYATFERMAIIFAQGVILDDASFYHEILSHDHIIEMKEDLMDQLKLLRPDAVPLTYTFWLKDKMIGALGANDMNGYQRFLNCVENTAGVYERPSEWKYLSE